MVYRPINHAECWKNCFDSIGKVSYHCSIWLQRFGIRSFQYCTWKLYSSVHNKTQDFNQNLKWRPGQVDFPAWQLIFHSYWPNGKGPRQVFCQLFKKNLTTWCSHVESTQIVVTWNWNDDLYCSFEQIFCYKFSCINSEKKLTHVGIIIILLSESHDPPKVMTSQMYQAL